MYPSYLEAEKTGSQLFQARKLFCSYLEKEKRSSQIVGARNKTMTAISCQKLWFATNWKEKNVVHKLLEQEKRG